MGWMSKLSGLKTRSFFKKEKGIQIQHRDCTENPYRRRSEWPGVGLHVMSIMSISAQMANWHAFEWDQLCLYKCQSTSWHIGHLDSMPCFPPGQASCQLFPSTDILPFLCLAWFIWHLNNKLHGYRGIYSTQSRSLNKSLYNSYKWTSILQWEDFIGKHKINPQSL